jgi:hypothetical protein
MSFQWLQVACCVQDLDFVEIVLNTVDVFLASIMGASYFLLLPMKRIIGAIAFF